MSQVMRWELTWLRQVWPEVTLVHGGARGADSQAGQIGREVGLEVEVFEAEWDRYGRSAGFKRNQAMLDSGVDLVWAFVDKPLEDSRGTAHMVRIAREAGVQVRVFRYRADGPQRTGPAGGSEYVYGDYGVLTGDVDE
jgi:hypothetical protein